MDNLNVQLEKSLKNESDLHDKVGDLSQTLNLRDSHGHQTEERLAKVDRNLERVNIEKDVLQRQLDTSQASLQVRVMIYFINFYLNIYVPIFYFGREGLLPPAKTVQLNIVPKQNWRFCHLLLGIPKLQWE